jgi:PKD repeat protein
VAIPQAAIHPVVFLPGLGATNPPVYYTNYRDKGAVDRLLTLGNFVGRYGDFYAALERLGYERNKTYFLFPYDWLVTTQYTARKLRDDLLKPASSDLINSVPYVRTYFQPDNTQQVKFDLIGHSTGNLVARSYIQTDEWAGYVRRFVSIAGPHKGLPKGYTMFEGVGEEDNTPFVCNVTKDIACLAYYWAAPLAEKVGYARRVCLSGGACFTSWNDEERYLFIHDPIWDRRDGQSWPGSITGFLPTYTEFPYLVDTNGSAYEYGRLLNPLLETVDERGMHTKVIGGATVQFMQYDPYGDNPYIMANLLRRYNATGYTSNYHGLNSPEKMDLLNQRIGDTTSNNVCLIYAGGRGLRPDGGDLPQVADADWSSTIDTRVQVQVSEPSYFALHWFTGMRDNLASDRYGLGDRFIPEVSAGPADIWVGSLRGDYDIEKEVRDLNEDFTVDHGDLVGYGITHKYVAHCLLGSAPAFLATTPSGKAPEEPPGYQAQNRTVGVASLQTSASLQATPGSSFLNRALMVAASGPVELTLTDAQGRRLGSNSAGDVYLEIPNGNYVADTDLGLKYLLAWSPEVGSATLTLTGSSDGDNKVMVWYRDTSGQVSLMHLEGRIASGIVVNQALVIPVEARTVPQPPEVVVGADLTAQVGQPVALTGRVKDINPGDAHTIGWDFGDGQTAAGSVTASHTYLAAGTFTATLTVTDTTGFVVSNALQVVVSGSRPPLVIEAGNDQTGSQGQVLTFTATLTDPLSLPGTALAWNFGDGATSAGTLTATHAYSAPGVYTVTVTANATDGRQASDALRVTITSGTAQPVRPVLECVVQNSSTSYTAWFGYKNDNPVAVTIPVGSTNKFTPNPQNRGQTTVFQPGRQVRVFSVLFDGNNLVWTLAGRTSTASRNSARCP